ncbi:hypothetical protein SAMN05421805_12768 [Saccharopolyspora antimicrobica]|uniref:Uncharacterized protein n=1 Tax=Saccharopolyspora antimicrobica TaxID=455193 RepID=A0A1I5KL65_9PSEU|nr:hypothetical protein [Saccharopolyspora antimicrobica]RKT85629.1 hypothetical protein ATL45_3976 [Saccharopolyspora antimicrobica]SFO85798.1 hypothetical protein SAMN05421805_12768 [Saccharopolyspora antimicrobica]
MTTGQLPLGLADRHQGQAAALAAATAGHLTYRERCEAALAELVARGEPFSADDVRALAGDDEGAGCNVLPSVIGVAAHPSAPDRIAIAPTSQYYRSTRRTRRASRNRVWIARAAARPAA